MNTTNIEKLVEMIKDSNGKIFSVTFIKKDGSERVLNGRLGVTKYLTGKGMSYDPAKYSLLPVFDLQKNAYRMVNLGTIQKLSCGGESWSKGD